MRITVVLSSLLIAVGAATGVQAKTAKECRAEWQANKAQNQAQHITERSYVEKCRAGTAAGPTTAPASSNAPAPAAPARTATTPTRGVSAGGQYQTEAQAKSACGSDTVVWVNTRSKVYHFAGTHNYGHTKSGAYMCERSAQAAGDRAAKNEKHP